jgi:Skp family chaperone for outer membrane proteins
MSLTRAGVAPLVSVVALCGMLGHAQAQKAPPAPTPAPAPAPAPAASPGLNILVVDVQSLLLNSKSAKMVRQQIEQKRAEYAKEISHQEEVLRQERDTLQRQQASLSAEALNQKGREFQQKVNELDKSVQGKRQALERSNAEALQKIQAVMLKIITDISKTRKANLVFQRSELVLFDQGFDVTDEVLQKLDEQLPTLTVNFVAPVASNAPAGTPAQPAAPPPPAAKKKRK